MSDVALQIVSSGVFGLLLLLIGGVWKSISTRQEELEKRMESYQSQNAAKLDAIYEAVSTVRIEDARIRQALEDYHRRLQRLEEDRTGA